MDHFLNQGGFAPAPDPPVSTALVVSPKKAAVRVPKQPNIVVTEGKESLSRIALGTKAAFAAQAARDPSMSPLWMVALQMKRLHKAALTATDHVEALRYERLLLACSSAFSKMIYPNRLAIDVSVSPEKLTQKRVQEIARLMQKGTDGVYSAEPDDNPNPE